MDLALVEETSDQFVGQWRLLVSTTNWEKGRIILEWRDSLIKRAAPASEYSDDAWSRRVGHVTPQHVGRLRRVFERFAHERDKYAGLFWSHFQAALDWDDAEMWLEGAVQNDWSIAGMRAQRNEALGLLATDESVAENASDEPWDDDAPGDDDGEVIGGAMEAVRDPAEAYGREDGDGADHDREPYDDSAEEKADDVHAAAVAEQAVRPFAELPPLPADVNDAFEAYKLCILRHKLAGWQEISRDDMLATLDSLKQLALAPAE
ncbi:MAG: hypothetical protein WD845_02965 [Pirellulales bacterium]